MYITPLVFQVSLSPWSFSLEVFSLLCQTSAASCCCLLLPHSFSSPGKSGRMEPNGRKPKLRIGSRLFPLLKLVFGFYKVANWNASEALFPEKYIGLAALSNNPPSVKLVIFHIISIFLFISAVGGTLLIGCFCNPQRFWHAEKSWVCQFSEDSKWYVLLAHVIMD